MAEVEQPFAAYLADEVGQAFLRHGDYVVKTMLEPVFANRDGVFVPAGFRATSGYFHVDRLARGPENPHVEPEFEMACNLAHIRNFVLVRERESASLLLEFSPLTEARWQAFLPLLDDEIAASEIDPRSITCELAAPGARPRDEVEAEAGMLRERGIRICLGGFGSIDLAPATVERLKPDLVLFDADWLRRAARIRQGRAMLPPLARSVRACGISVMAGDVVEDADLALAREMGVDLLAGPALAQPFLAGAASDSRPRPAGGAQPADVVRLRG